MRSCLTITAILAVSMSACASTPEPTGALPMALVGATDEWSGMLSESGVQVSSSQGELAAPPTHLSASASMVLMNAEISATDYVTVLLTRESCAANGRAYLYSAYFGHRRAAEGDYVLHGCAETVGSRR